jgi:hypothetical protein
MGCLQESDIVLPDVREFDVDDPVMICLVGRGSESKCGISGRSSLQGIPEMVVGAGVSWRLVIGRKLDMLNEVSDRYGC